MRHFAAFNEEDVDLWGIVGLCHDLDYERFPNKHCAKTKEILESENWDPIIIRAIVSHGWGICSDAEPISKMEKTLFAIDELCGLIYACALVRPDKKIAEVELKSVKKKWKMKSFAAGANRELITLGAKRLNVELDELINETLAAMKNNSQAIGL
jgi:predicted hydrolase (HD superfamily)